MDMPDEIKEALDKAAKSGRFGSLEEAQDFIFQLMTGYNQRPQPELCGLSPEQIHKLTFFDWESAASAVRLNHDISLRILKDTPILENARILLAVLAEAPVKTTGAGNLNRKFVARMLEEMSWPGARFEFILKRGKTINEEDYLNLHVLRILLGQTGAIKRRKGYFSITKKGAAFLRPEKAGELYAQLFLICFTKLNLAYLDGLPDDHVLQRMIAVPLYVMFKNDSSERTIKEIKETVWPETLRKVTEESPYFDPLLSQTRIRLLEPLSWFGLVEIERPRHGDIENYMIRKTELYDRFLRFEFTSPVSDLKTFEITPGSFFH